eukprot:m.636396 g.636396  ORF g.636396 m.636396 type:complete len:96 (-) comp22592_c0_seq5:2053-2340(-)
MAGNIDACEVARPVPRTAPLRAMAVSPDSRMRAVVKGSDLWVLSSRSEDVIADSSHIASLRIADFGDLLCVAWSPDGTCTAPLVLLVCLRLTSSL